MRTRTRTRSKFGMRWMQMSFNCPRSRGLILRFHNLFLTRDAGPKPVGTTHSVWFSRLRREKPARALHRRATYFKKKNVRKLGLRVYQPLCPLILIVFL